MSDMEFNTVTPFSKTIKQIALLSIVATFLVGGVLSAMEKPEHILSYSCEVAP